MDSSNRVLRFEDTIEEETVKSKGRLNLRRVFCVWRLVVEDCKLRSGVERADMKLQAGKVLRTAGKPTAAV